MLSVAIHEPLLEAVSAEPQVRADGGATVEGAGSNHSNERPDDCDCLPLMEDLPCWPCYRDGFEEPNSHAEVSDE